MADQNEAPSVLEQLKKVRSPESKVEIYLQACREVQYERPDEATWSMQPRPDRRRERPKLTKLSRSTLSACRGSVTMQHATLKMHLKYLRKTVPRYKRHKDKLRPCTSLTKCGYGTQGIGSERRSTHCLPTKSERSWKRSAKTTFLRLYLTNIGATWSVLDRPKEALEAYSECHHTSRTSCMMTGWHARILGNIAEVYISIGDLETGVEWSKRSLEQHRRNGDQMGVGLTLTNLGTGLSGAGRP